MADNDALFQEAVEALRVGNKNRARELFTSLLKTDQNNATYWVWMSSTVESTRERIYCLQTAHKLDPENAAAKRGLILHGGLPPDENIQPFPVNRPRAWEQKLLLEHEKPKPKGWAAIKASPVARVGGLIVLGALVIGGLVFGAFQIVANRPAPPATITPGPSPTYTLTPTSVNATGQPAVVGTPAPLSELLSAPYTPTPLYVNTPQHSPFSQDAYRAGRLAYEKGDWDEVISKMQDVVRAEPEAADAYYYIGEAYRFKGNPSSALNAYNLAQAANGSFGPAYVGIARARLLINPDANVTSFLDEAIRLDPGFGEAYLERGIARARQKDIPGALSDLGEANRLLPGSPLVYFYLAQTRLLEGDMDLALTAARRSNELDVTSLPTYLLLGQIYAQMGDEAEAVKNLELYLTYRPQDTGVYLLLGKMYFNQAEYEKAIDNMNKVIARDRNLREPYLIRFLSNLELGRGDQADKDLETVELFYPNSFDVYLAAIRLNVLQERYGNALLLIDRTEAMAETDEQKALIYYWGAKVYEAREELDNAAEFWDLLLGLPKTAMTTEMRAEAEKQLSAISTPTRTVTPSRTPTPTKKIPTKTPTRTPIPSKTPVPSKTPIPSKTPTPTRTPTQTPTRTPTPTS